MSVGSRALAVPLSAGLLGAYALLHSPLRNAIGALLRSQSAACYLSCQLALGTAGLADGLSLGDMLDRRSAGSPVDALAALLLLVLAVLAAWSMADRFDGPAYEWPVVAGLTMMFLATVPAVLVAGIASATATALLRPPLGPLLVSLPSAGVLVRALANGWRPRCPCVALPRGVGVVLVGVAVVLLGLSMVVSLTHPPTGYDALGYHAVLEVLMWSGGSLTAHVLDGLPPDMDLGHPATAELWFGLLRLVGGERLADLGQVPWLALAGLAVAAIARRLRLRSGAALLSAAAFWSAPLVVAQAGLQLNDLVGAGLLLATLALACAPFASWSKARIVLLAVGLGLIVSTKVALLPSAAGAAIFVLGAIVRARRPEEPWPPTIRRLGILAGTVLVVAGPWWTRNVLYFGNPLYPGALPFIGRGMPQNDPAMLKDRLFVPSAVAWPLYPLLEPHNEYSGAGAVFTIAALIGFAFAVRRVERQPLVLFGVVAAVSVPFWWALTAHEPRFLLGVAALGFPFVPWLLLAAPRSQRRVGAAILAAAAVFSGLVTIDQAIMPVARAPGERTSFYDRLWLVDPFVANLPESESLVMQTGLARTTYPAYYPLLGPGLMRAVQRVDVDATSDGILGLMRRTGVHYAYVSVAPEHEASMRTKYSGAWFAVEHLSVVAQGELAGTRRYLLRLHDAADGNSSQ